MPASGAAAAWRRFTLTISGSNINMFDSGTPANPANSGGFTTQTALAAAGTQTLNLFTLAGGSMILACKCKPTVAFTGGAVTVTTVEVGRASGTDIYLPRFNIFTAVADTPERRMLQMGPVIRTATAEGRNGAGVCQALGLVVGDKVESLNGFSIDAGWTTTASIAAAGNSYTPGIEFESIVTVADQLQQLVATDLSAFAILTQVRRGGGLESDAAAGTAINIILRTTTANVSALTAGSMEIDLLISDAPLASLGNG